MNHSKIILFYLIIINWSTAFSQQTQDAKAKADTFSYSKFEVLPQFPGGNEKLNEFIASNIAYPEKAKRKGTVGTSYISFIVKKSGEIATVKTHKGIPNCSACDDEAIRVIKLMPNWIPGKQDGKVVDVQHILPVKFSLK